MEDATPVTWADVVRLLKNAQEITKQLAPNGWGSYVDVSGCDEALEDLIYYAGWEAPSTGLAIQ